ncbi:MAG: lysine--tRNA ligase [Bacilli bacterium]
MEKLTDQELARRAKLEDFKSRGVNPYGSSYKVTSDSKELKEKYGELTKEELETKNITVSVAGRIMTKRVKGKAGFMNLQDKFGQIQIYVKIDNIGEDMYYIFDKNDLGDIVGIEGKVMKTHTGELSVEAHVYTHLSKSIRPLPEKYHGLVDVEERFRRRYVDLIMNDEAKRIAFLRPKIIRSIQNYLDDLGYTEVETPILGTIRGGANARPFITKHNALGIEMYLRIATELHLKRLIVGGMDAVYEIGRIFRNEGMDKNHNPEFTTIELYKAYSDLEGMMNITEALIKNALEKTINTLHITFRGNDLDFSKPFKRVKMTELIKEKTGINFEDHYTLEEAKKIAIEHNIEIEEHFEYGHIVEAFYDKYCEETIVEPTFIYSYPIEISPLAKKNELDPRFTERFELFICGGEYANAFSELNDPIDQRERFESQVKQQELGNDEANDMDVDYCEALEYGLPPTGGMGMGIDRLVMLIASADTIREVILFPTMKERTEQQ